MSRANNVVPMAQAREKHVQPRIKPYRAPELNTLDALDEIRRELSATAWLLYTMMSIPYGPEKLKFLADCLTKKELLLTAVIEKLERRPADPKEPR